MSSMKKVYKRILTLMMMLLIVLTLAGCEQLSGLTSLLPGAESEAAQEENAEPVSETGLVSGDIADLQTPSSWVYLIEESKDDGQSPTGILVFNPQQGGYKTDSVTGAEAYIEWDGREFDLECKPCSAKGWYMSVPLATNIRKDDFVLRVNLLRGEEEADEEIRMENPKIELLAWPAPASKDGIIMQKDGDSYSFSAKTITDLFTCEVPALFSYRIKECTDCNIQLDGENLSYLNIASSNASFIVEVTDPAGAVQETEIRIRRNVNFRPYLIGGAAAAVITAAVIFFLLKGTGVNKKQVNEALEALVDPLSEAKSLQGQCRKLPGLAGTAKAAVLGKIGIFGAGIIDEKLVAEMAAPAETILDEGEYITLSRFISDLEDIQDILQAVSGFGGKRKLNQKSRNLKWTARSFMTSSERSRHLTAVNKTVEEMREIYEDAKNGIEQMNSLTRIGEDPFTVDFTIRVTVEEKQWTTFFNHTDTRNKETRRISLGDLFYTSPKERLRKGSSLFGRQTAYVNVISVDGNGILLFSNKGFEIIERIGASGNGKVNSLLIHKNQIADVKVFSVSGEAEEIEVEL